MIYVLCGIGFFELSVSDSSYLCILFNILFLHNVLDNIVVLYASLPKHCLEMHRSEWTSHKISISSSYKSFSSLRWWTSHTVSTPPPFPLFLFGLPETMGKIKQTMTFSCDFRIVLIPTRLYCRRVYFKRRKHHRTQCFLSITTL